MTAVGVPEISPVEVENARPAGSVASIAQEMTVPPLYVGVDAVIRESFVKVNGLSLYETEEGIMSLTTMVTVAVVLPPELVAVTVYAADEATAVGVPLNSPVVESITKPAGSDGETAQEVTAPPFEVGVVAVISVPLVRVKELGL